MKNPVHPGLLVNANLEHLGLSVAEAAAGMGITRQQLYRVIRCDSAVTSDMALRLEAAFGSTADMWLRMQAAYDLAEARNRNTAAGIERFAPKKVA